MMKSGVLSVLLGLTLFGVALVNAGEPAPAPKKAIAATESWLALVDEGKYVESWNEAASLFKNSFSREQWLQTMTGMRKSLGKKTARIFWAAEHYTSLPGAPDGRYVVVQFKSSFTNKTKAIETVTPMLDTDVKWRVSGYYLK